MGARENPAYAIYIDIGLLAAFLIAAVLVYLIIKAIERRLLGITGDVIGMTIEISPIIFAMAFSIVRGILWNSI